MNERDRRAVDGCVSNKSWLIDKNRRYTYNFSRNRQDGVGS